MIDQKRKTAGSAAHTDGDPVRYRQQGTLSPNEQCRKTPGLQPPDEIGPGPNSKTGSCANPECGCCTIEELAAQRSLGAAGRRRVPLCFEGRARPCAASNQQAVRANYPGSWLLGWVRLSFLRVADDTATNRRLGSSTSPVSAKTRRDDDFEKIGRAHV